MTTHRNPALTVDIVIEYGGGIVMIERANPPHGFALPGGFVDYGESVEAAAIREALEETSLTVTLRALLGVYSDPARDARQHTVSVVFVAQGAGDLAAADDAKTASAVSLDALPSPLCFDHARIVADYRTWLRSGNPPVPHTPLSDSDRRVLSDLAWQALSAAVALPISYVRPALRGGPPSQPGACFVTLRRKNGQPCGRAGSLDVGPVLATLVEELTLAATEDPKHPPVQRGDLANLHVEVSVVGHQLAITGPSEFILGTHGLAVRRGDRHAEVLPEIAVEEGLDAEGVLREACRLAGLPDDAWTDPQTQTVAFTTHLVVATND